MSAQKALQGSKTETRELLGGTEETSITPIRGHYNDFSQKRKQKKIELVARPGFAWILHDHVRANLARIQTERRLVVIISPRHRPFFADGIF